ncbi:Meiosis-specific serine/threonine-protein kinase mek1, partial [Pichia californica]
MNKSAGKLYNSNIEILLSKNTVYAFGRLPYDKNDERVHRIQINEPHLSLTHCYIWIIQFDNESNNICYFQDVSRNGCLINNEIVGNNKFKIINNNDLIKLYNGIEFKYQSNNNELNENEGNIIETKKWKILPVIIGFGTFGKVQVAINKKENGKMYAVKTIFNLNSINNKIEHEILSKVNHKNVIKVKESSISNSNNNKIKIFQELAIGGDLFSYLSQDKAHLCKIPESEAIFAIYQICKGLNYLHNNGIVHRDLKLDNILVMDVPIRYPRLKIGDFGIAKKHLPIGESQINNNNNNNNININIEEINTFRKSRKSYWMNTIVGTAEYAAPEINMRNSKSNKENKFNYNMKDFFAINESNSDSNDFNQYNEKVDSWSLGVISHILLSGVSPFYSEDIKDILEK